MTTEHTVLSVLLNDVRVGRLIGSGNVTRFVIDEEYWELPSRPVLGLAFEDQPSYYPSAAVTVPIWFANLLPEGKLKRLISEKNDLQIHEDLKLLESIGNDLPGAVRIVRDDDSQFDARLLTQPEVEQNTAANPVPEWKFSLAGVALKFSFLYTGKRLTVPGKNEFGDHIVKFPDPNHPHLPHVEYWSMRLAAETGIETPAVLLLPREDVPNVPEVVWPTGEGMAYAVQRFDRTPSGQRVHIEDFCQVLKRRPDDKYKGNFETLAKVFFAVCGRSSLDEFCRRLVFNLLIGNGDAHAKNWSLIYPDTQKPVISPAYDLVSTRYYLGNSENLGLKLNKNRLFGRVTRHDFVHLASKVGLSQDELLPVVDNTIDQFFAALDALGDHIEPAVYKQWLEDHATIIAGSLR